MEALKVREKTVSIINKLKDAKSYVSRDLENYHKLVSNIKPNPDFKADSDKNRMEALIDEANQKGISAIEKSIYVLEREIVSTEKELLSFYFPQLTKQFEVLPGLEMSKIALDIFHTVKNPDVLKSILTLYRDTDKGEIVFLVDDLLKVSKSELALRNVSREIVISIYKENNFIELQDALNDSKSFLEGAQRFIKTLGSMRTTQFSRRQLDMQSLNFINQYCKSLYSLALDFQ
jgi:hypothetical protein